MSLHAGLVADPALELADALLPGVGSGRHLNRVDGRTLAEIRWRPRTSPTTPCCGACIARRSSRCPGPRALLMQAAHPLAVRGVLLATRRARRPLRAAAPHGRGDGHDRLGLAGRRRPHDPARARDARARVAGRSAEPRRAASRPARRRRPTTPSCCCGSSPTWSTRRVVVYERYVARADAATSATPTGRTTASSAGCSACARRHARRPGTTSSLHVGHARRRRPARDADRARAVGIEVVLRAAGAAGGPAAASSWPTSSPSACCRAASAAATASRGTRRRAIVLRGGAEYVKRVLVPLLPSSLRYVPAAA